MVCVKRFGEPAADRDAGSASGLTSDILVRKQLRSVSRRLVEAGRSYKHRQHDAHEEQRRDISQQVTHMVSVAEGLHRHERGVDNARNRGEPDEAEISLQVSRMVIAPPEPPRSSTELRAYLRRWVGPAMNT